MHVSKITGLSCNDIISELFSLLVVFLLSSADEQQLHNSVVLLMEKSPSETGGALHTKFGNGKNCSNEEASRGEFK